MSTYVFDNSWERERERLGGLEAALDPGTMRHMDSLGLAPGWECLEIGGGGGSITEWLCKRVGKSGRVVATDLDTRFLDAIAEPNLEVLHHDIVNDDLPEAAFDLIHSRLVLEHLPPREQVLKRLVKALKPGGAILIEDMDWRGLLATPTTMVTYPPSDARNSVRVWRGVVAMMSSAGYDHVFGAKLLPLMVDIGLDDVGVEARNPMYNGGSPTAAAPRFTLEELSDRMVEMGLVSKRQVDREIERARDPKRRRMWPTMIATWGRRPSGNGKLRGAESAPVPARLPRERLPELALFAGCTTEEISRIVNIAKEVAVDGGHALTREGEAGDAFYVILQGTATVTREGEKLATLGPGSFFGETALLTGGPRTATVITEGDATLASFDQHAFDALLSESRIIARRILEGVAERSPAATSQVFP